MQHDPHTPASRGFVPHGIVVDDPDALEVILRRDVNLCVWSRSLAPALSTWLLRVRDSVACAAEERLYTLAPDASRLVRDLPMGAERELLRLDLEALVRRYGRIVGEAWVDVSLATVARDMCRRFHADYVGIRLLCTYSGPGTEWVDDAWVCRRRAVAEESFTDANRALVPDPSRIRSLGEGHVGLLKGHAWPGNEGLGVIHRSPPIEHLGVRRLVLKIDARKPGAHSDG